MDIKREKSLGSVGKESFIKILELQKLREF